MKRRDVLKACAAAAAGGGALYALFRQGGGAGGEKINSFRPAGNGEAAAGRQNMTEARYYTALDDGSAQCRLCFRECLVPEGGNGFCRNRINSDGKLSNVVYGAPSAVNVEPTEKEPMHHFLPGTNMLCIGTASCNFRCCFCHNWHLSQRSFDEVRRRHSITPGEMARRAVRHGVPAVSFTYNEPTVFYEYMYDVAQKSKDEGLKTIMHTNGGISPEPLKDLLPYIDGVALDLKAFSNEFYRDVCDAELEPVLENLKIIKEKGIWLEIVNLVVPGYNDDPDQVREMCRWIVEELDPETPLHLSRFSPSYRMTDLSPTPVSTLERCKEIASEAGLLFISIGNVPGHKANSSFCPDCGTRIIQRHHFSVGETNMKNGACGECGRKIPGVWQ